MLVRFINAIVSTGSFYLLFFTSLLALSVNRAAAEEITPELKNISEYFLSVNQETSIDEVADHLVQLKIYVQSLGHQTPTWDAVIDAFKEGLQENGNLITDEDRERIKSLLITKEAKYAYNNTQTNACNINQLPIQQFILGKPFRQILGMFSKKHHHKHKTKNSVAKQPEMSDNMAISVMIAAGGALCCILPIPGAIWVGEALILYAGYKAFDEIGEISKQNRINQNNADHDRWKDGFLRSYKIR